jgi:hypothetical protein
VTGARFTGKVVLVTGGRRASTEPSPSSALLVDGG